MHGALRIAPLTLAKAAATAAAWPLEYETLLGRLRWHVSTAYAQAFVATHGASVQGVGCSVMHGTSGRINLLRAHSTEVHTALATALLAELEAQGARTVSLLAPEAEAPLWAAHGFEARERMLHYAGGRFTQATRDEVVPAEPQHRFGLLHLDRCATGEDRSNLLLEHGYLASVYAEGHAVRGFVLPLLGEGLIVADAPSVGLELQRWLFPVHATVRIPEGNAAAHAHLLAQKYQAQPIGVRMVRGPQPPYRPELIYAWPWGVG